MQVTEVRWVMQVKYIGDAGNRGKVCDAGKVGNTGNRECK